MFDVKGINDYVGQLATIDETYCSLGWGDQLHDLKWGVRVCLDAGLTFAVQIPDLVNVWYRHKQPKPNEMVEGRGDAIDYHTGIVIVNSSDVEQLIEQEAIKLRRFKVENKPSMGGGYISLEVASDRDVARLENEGLMSNSDINRWVNQESDKRYVEVSIEDLFVLSDSQAAHEQQKGSERSSSSKQKNCETKYYWGKRKVSKEKYEEYSLWQDLTDKKYCELKELRKPRTKSKVCTAVLNENDLGIDLDTIIRTIKLPNKR